MSNTIPASIPSSSLPLPSLHPAAQDLSSLIHFADEAIAESLHPAFTKIQQLIEGHAAPQIVRPVGQELLAFVREDATRPSFVMEMGLSFLTATVGASAARSFLSRVPVLSALSTALPAFGFILRLTLTHFASNTLQQGFNLFAHPEEGFSLFNTTRDFRGISGLMISEMGGMQFEFALQAALAGLHLPPGLAGLALSAFRFAVSRFVGGFFFSVSSAAELTLLRGINSTLNLFGIHPFFEIDTQETASMHFSVRTLARNTFQNTGSHLGARLWEGRNQVFHRSLYERHTKPVLEKIDTVLPSATSKAITLGGTAAATALLATHPEQAMHVLGWCGPVLGAAFLQHRGDPKGVLNATDLARLLQRRRPEDLRVDPRSGPPYHFGHSDAVDTARTLEMTSAYGKGYRVNQAVLTDEQLRDPNIRILFSDPPANDWHRRFVHNGIIYTDNMSDVMASMTSVANPPHRRLYSEAPRYNQAFLKSVLGDRVRFVKPNTLSGYREMVKRFQPDVVALSGLHVNVPILVQMALIAKQHGARETILGGDAAMSPLRDIDHAFNRTFWAGSGGAEEFAHDLFIGGEFPGHHTPALDDMIAGVSWLTLDHMGHPQRVHYETLHMVLRMGCTQSCGHCAEGPKSNQGKARPSTPFEEAKQTIDAAHARGIRAVYFLDPDFGRLDHINPLGLQVVEYLHSKGMRWSCLTNVPAATKHGDFWIRHGFSSGYLGVETFNDVRVLRRGWQKEGDTLDVIRSFREQGVMVFGLYVLFNPGESMEQVRRGVEIARDELAISQISTNQPLPGTAEFRDAVANGLIYDYSEFRYGTLPWAPAGAVFTPEAVRETYVWAHNQVNRLDRPGGYLDALRARSKHRR